MDMGIDDRKIGHGVLLAACPGHTLAAARVRIKWAGTRGTIAGQGGTAILLSAPDGKRHPKRNKKSNRERSVAVLSLRKISKSFGAIRALTDIDLELEPGEVLGLMGDNGAGKSTMVKIIAGNFPPTSGEIVLQDTPVHFHKPLDARNSGIEIVYQDLALCDNLTAAANVFLSREVSTPLGFSWRAKDGRRFSFPPLKLLNSRAMSERAGELFGELKSETRPHDVVRRMSGGQRQAVAIARTRLSEAKIVLMDEPTAAISVRQVAQVLDLIRRLRDRGIAIVLISHRMPDVFAVADRVAVLRRGRKVAEKPIAKSSPEEVTGLITGAIQHA
ncbi:MAG TPA: ATP-binding cassette domain-containing protein [Bauldia sp.]|nr:ATP-binding cassette domain-containing protein [Bauldia sp.]